MSDSRYMIYSKYLKEKYGEKVYKIPIELSATCPNRDGVVATGGCIFCGEKGAGFENLEGCIPVEKQLSKNIEYISKRYKAKKFIAYFQNFTNTYMPIEEFKKYIRAVCREDVVQIAVSTRPDCINDEILSFLNEIKEEKNMDITIEMGLQSVNYKTLEKINRGHTLAEFIDAMWMIKKYDFEVCTHMILNLPWDSMDDIIEGAKIISALRIDQIKLHSLYIVEDSMMGKMYKNHEFQIIEMSEYVERVVRFLEYLNPDIAVQRLVGRAPKEETLFCNWNTSWWKIKDYIDELLEKEDSYQGKKYKYLGGKALK